MYSCLLILTPVFCGGFLYIFHVYLEEWHSDVSRHGRQVFCPSDRLLY
nr:MAG TPA: hypothetical protein [Caudoviricetes sp.]